MDLTIGHTLDEKYVLEEEIGSGGMGVVVKACRLADDVRVAVKYCKTDDDDDRRRFSREIRFMSSIDHPHVMPVLDSNESHDPPYFVMPLAENSLEDEVRDLANDLDLALTVMLEMCSGVQAFHAAGGIHRDVKPSNFLRMGDGKIVLSDFGLSKFEFKDTTIITNSIETLGTQIYIAPEASYPGGSRDADARTDIFMLGKTFYRILTADHPLLIDPTAMPTGIGYVVEKMTRNLPKDRYQTVSEVQDSLQNFKDSLRPGADPVYDFEVQVQKVKSLLDDGKYEKSGIEKIMTLITGFSGDPGILLDRFDEIPSEALSVMESSSADELAMMLRAYGDAVESAVGGYTFSYAEQIAARMQIIFRASRDSTIKALAIRPVLFAAVTLNRFAAMDMFDSMILDIQADDDGEAVANMLRDQLTSYRQLADRLSPTQLHRLIRQVQREAMT